MIKKKLLLEPNNLSYLMAFGDTLVKMGDMKGAIRYYYNIQGQQMMRYFSDNLEGQLGDDSNDEYLAKMDMCQRVQGILNMDYGLLKQTPVTLASLEFTDRQVVQQDMMDFKGIFDKCKFSPYFLGVADSAE